MTNFFYIRQIFLLATFSILFGLGYACTDGNAQQQKKEEQKASKTVFSPNSKTFNVLILPFHPDKDCKTENVEMENKLMEFIGTSDWAQAMNINIQLLQDQACPYKPSIAQQLGKEQNADVIIWGFYNGKKQKPEILYTWINDVVQGHTGFPHLTDLRNGFYLKDDPNYIANWMIGVAAASKNKWAEALAHFQVIATDKCDVAVTPMIGHCYYVLHKEPQVDSIMQKIVGCVPDYVAIAMRGWRHYVGKKNQEAVNDYTESLKKNPRYKSAYEHRATIFFENKKYKEAIHDFTQAIKLGTDEETVYGLRGVAYHNSDDREAAIKDYTKALELNPNYSKAYYDRANAHYILGQYDEAVKDYTAAIGKETSTKRAYLNRGITYVEIDNYEAAIADFTHVIEAQPENVTALAYRGAANSFHGKLNEARADFTKALYLDPDNKMALKGVDYWKEREEIKLRADEMDRLEAEAVEGGVIKPKMEDGKAKFDLRDFPTNTPPPSKK
ncbi:MAG: tetratricopeptide repeat protein [Chitinophagales bacterium]